MKYWGRYTTSISNPNWNEITNKPSILNDGLIDWNEIINKPSILNDGLIYWNEIQGKPTSFATDKLTLSNLSENIRVKKFTGNLPSSASARQAMVQHGIADGINKIMGVTALLNFNGLLLPPNYATSSGLEYNITIDSSWISGATYTSARSSLIYGKSVNILILHLE